MIAIIFFTVERMLEIFNGDIFSNIMEYMNYREIWLMSVCSKSVNDKLSKNGRVWESLFSRVFEVKWNEPSIMTEPSEKETPMIKVETWREAYNHWKKKLTKLVFGYVGKSYTISRIFAGIVKCRKYGCPREDEIVFITLDDPFATGCYLCSFQIFGPCQACYMGDYRSRRCKMIIPQCGHYFHSHCLDVSMRSYIDLYGGLSFCPMDGEEWICKFKET